MEGEVSQKSRTTLTKDLKRLIFPNVVSVIAFASSAATMTVYASPKKLVAPLFAAERFTVEVNAPAKFASSLHSTSVNLP